MQMCETMAAEIFEKLTAWKATASMKTKLITREGYDKLKTELDFLWRKSVLR